MEGKTEEEEGVAGVEKKDGLVVRLRGEIVGDVMFGVLEVGNE